MVERERQAGQLGLKTCFGSTEDSRGVVAESKHPGWLVGRILRSVVEKVRLGR